MGAAPIDVDHARSPSFGLADELGPGTTAWHAHRRHQLLFAASGAMHLELEAGQWLLPPGRSACVPARTRHRVRTTGPVSLRTVYLSPRDAPAAPATTSVFVAPPLARELVLHLMRWGPATSPREAAARACFRAIGALVPEWARANPSFALPAARSEEIARVMRAVLDRLGRPVRAAALAKSCGLGLRTLERRFAEETGTTLRAFVRQARMLRAIELLSRPGARVGVVARAVGFASDRAFLQAFREFTGEAPREFLRRSAVSE